MADFDTLQVTQFHSHEISSSVVKQLNTDALKSVHLVYLS